MGTFEITRARQKLGFTPATSVRGDLDVRGTGGIGGAIGQALLKGTAIGLELFQRKQQMDDNLTRADAQKIRTDAELEIELFRTENADTRLWPKQAEEVFGRANNQISSLEPSNRMRRIINSETSAWSSKQGTQFTIEEIEQKKQDTKVVMIDEIVEAFRVNDPERKVVALENFDINARRIFSPDEAKMIRRNAITAGFKAYFKDRAGKDAEGTIELLNSEVDTRKKGRGKIPEEVMTNSELRSAIGDAQTIMKESRVAFENVLNGELIRIDNTPNMSQLDFDAQAEELKTTILIANIPNTRKRRLLTDLEKWRRGTSEIDYAKVLSLNQEMDAAQRSGIVDPTIKDRIIRASLEGAFGGRNKGGQKTYGDMIRRFEKLQFDERVEALDDIMKQFRAINKHDLERIYLFEKAKNKFVADNPDMSTRELFIEVMAMSENYTKRPPFLIERMIRPGRINVVGKTVRVIHPDGRSGVIPIGQLEEAKKEGYEVVE